MGMKVFSDLDLAVIERLRRQRTPWHLLAQIYHTTPQTLRRALLRKDDPDHYSEDGHRPRRGLTPEDMHWQSYWKKFRAARLNRLET